MRKTEITKRAEVVAEQFAGCEIMEAVHVLGEALNIASKKDPLHIAIAVYYIGKLIEEMHGRSALIRIDDNGKLSFSIGANGVEQKLF